MTPRKIENINGVLKVYCPRIDSYRDVHACETCSKRVGMPDPVKNIIKCKES